MAELKRDSQRSETASEELKKATKKSEETAVKVAEMEVKIQSKLNQITSMLDLALKK